MTWIEVEGFEVYGDDSTAGNDVEAAIDLRPSLDYVEGTGSPDSLSLEVGDNQGYALTMPATIGGQNYQIRWEYPSAYKVTMNAAGPVMVCGFRVKAPTDTNGVDKAMWGLNKTASAGAAIFVEWGDDGNDLIAGYSSGSTRATGCCTPGDWHYIEIHWKAGSAAHGGFVDVYVDGTRVIESGSVATEIFFNSTYGMRFQQEPSTGAWALDDVCLYEDDGVTHTGPIGAREIHAVVPTGDASPNDWTPSTGSDNYAMIDEDELDTADYVTSASDGDDEHYSHGAIGSSGVDCLQIDVECIATSGTPTLHVGISDDTDSIEDDDGVIGTGSNTVVRKLFTTQPDATAWDTAGLNSVEQTQRVTE